MTSDGSYIVQTIYRTSPSMSITAVSDDRTDFQTRQSNDIAPMGLGYEHVINAKLAENATIWANDAVAKLSAKPVEPGRYDLLLHPSNLWLTVHETIAHPTERIARWASRPTTRARASSRRRTSRSGSSSTARS